MWYIALGIHLLFSSITFFAALWSLRKEYERNVIYTISDIIRALRHLTAIIPSPDFLFFLLLTRLTNFPFLLELSCTISLSPLAMKWESQPVPEPKWRIKEMFMPLWTTSLPSCLHMWVSNWSTRHIKCQAKTTVQQMLGTRRVIVLKKKRKTERALH